MPYEALPQAATYLPEGMMWDWESHVQTFSSPLNNNAKRRQLWGVWRVDMNWNGLDQDDAAPLMAFLNKYKDGGVFTIYHPTKHTPRGTARGTVGSPVGRVNGASQSGRSLVTDGWAINQSALFRAGDLVSMLNTMEVYEISEDIASNGSGQATLKFSQPIRTSPADNEYVVCEYCPLRVFLAEYAPNATVAPPSRWSFSARMIEDQAVL